MSRLVLDTRSRFLDLHLYNTCAVTCQEELYNVCHVLAYKEMSSFTYIPSCSNIHQGYKHAVVPVSLFRIHTRNILQSDIDNHLSFMSKILKYRDQNPEEVKKKTRIFFKRKRTLTKPPRKDYSNMLNATLKFDRVSRRHVFMQKLFQYVHRKNLRIIYKSGSSIGSLICPKRRVIRLLSSSLK